VYVLDFFSWWGVGYVWGGQAPKPPSIFTYGYHIIGVINFCPSVKTFEFHLWQIKVYLGKYRYLGRFCYKSLGTGWGTSNIISFILAVGMLSNCIILNNLSFWFLDFGYSI